MRLTNWIVMNNIRPIKNVHNNTAKIQKHPAPVLHPLNMPQRDLLFLHDLHNVIGNCLDVTIGVPVCNNEVMSDTRQLRDV